MHIILMFAVYFFLFDNHMMKYFLIAKLGLKPCKCIGLDKKCLRMPASFSEGVCGETRIYLYDIIL